MKNQPPHSGPKIKDIPPPKDKTTIINTTFIVTITVGKFPIQY